MDHRKSVKRNRSEDAIGIDTCVNGNMSLLSIIPVSSIPETTSSISQYSNDDTLSCMMWIRNASMVY